MLPEKLNEAESGDKLYLVIQDHKELDMIT